MASEKVDLVLKMREGGRVQRCHTIPHVGECSVGEHTFHMLALLDALNPCANLELYRYVLQHDLHERYTGDPPGNLRWMAPQAYAAMKEYKSHVQRRVMAGHHIPDDHLTPEDHAWVTALDQLEFLLWCHDQANMGNESAAAMIPIMVEWFEANEDLVPSAVIRFVDEFEWRRMN